MKIAVCPGSFDPVTVGHMDIIRRAAKLFDRLIIVVMRNYHKSNHSFSVEERMELIERSVSFYGLENVEVDQYFGLLADYTRKKDAMVVVKGLRAVSDFEFEFQQALINKKLNADMETIFVNTSSENMYLSSSVVKQICELGGDISDLVPECIREDVVQRLRKGNSV